LLLSHPEDEEDEEPVSSTSEAISEDEVDVDPALRLLDIEFDEPTVTAPACREAEELMEADRCAVESRLAIPRTADVIAAENAEGSSSIGVGTFVCACTCKARAFPAFDTLSIARALAEPECINGAKCLTASISSNRKS